MPIESSGHSAGNPRLYEVIENSPKTGKSPTVWAWPQLIDYLKVAGQPVQGPWPPHQEPAPRPDRGRVRADRRPRSRTPDTADTDPTRRPSTELPSGSEKESAMYPPRFRYEAPRSLEEAIGLLSDGRR